MEAAPRAEADDQEQRQLKGISEASDQELDRETQRTFWGQHSA